jgi:hypothetical protein
LPAGQNWFQTPAGELGHSVALAGRLILSTHFIPGLVLLGVVGIGTTVASIFTIFAAGIPTKRLSDWVCFWFFSSPPRSGSLASRVFLQPLYLILGGLEVLLGLKISRIMRTAGLEMIYDA